MSPMSTIKGKGHWGQAEGLEKVMWLRGAARAFVNDAHNYRRVQVALGLGFRVCPWSLSVSKSRVGPYLSGASLAPRMRAFVSRRSVGFRV